MLRPSLKHLDALRTAAVVQLKSVHVKSVTKELELLAAQAEIIDQSETVQEDEGKIYSYYLTQIVRNTAGEYFLLKTTDCRPYVKHLSQARAKVVLKSKYREKGSHPPMASSDA
jgi:hypothetical protein